MSTVEDKAITDLAVAIAETIEEHNRIWKDIRMGQDVGYNCISMKDSDRMTLAIGLARKGFVKQEGGSE